MLRKTMLALLMLGGLAAPAAWGEKAPLRKDYLAWPYDEQSYYVGGVMQGIWSALKVSGGDPDALRECPIERWTLLQEISEQWLSPRNGDRSFRGVVLSAWVVACARPYHARTDEVHSDTHADYKTWPRPLQARYVAAVLEGLESAVDRYGTKWHATMQTAFRACKADQPAVSAILAKTADAADIGQPMADLIFIAYETVCLEARK